MAFDASRHISYSPAIVWIVFPLTWAVFCVIVATLALGVERLTGRSVMVFAMMAAGPGLLALTRIAVPLRLAHPDSSRTAIVLVWAAVSLLVSALAQRIASRRTF
ncbi:MAG TPA: hypothetical protein VF911_14210, partial [Thermoanaerobaculia bacterium]